MTGLVSKMVAEGEDPVDCVSGRRQDMWGPGVGHPHSSLLWVFRPLNRESTEMGIKCDSDNIILHLE